jgi:hypothetical protein
MEGPETPLQSATTAVESVWGSRSLYSAGLDGPGGTGASERYESDGVGPLERPAAVGSQETEGGDGSDNGEGSQETDEATAEDGIPLGVLERQQSQAVEIWKFRLRPADDDEPE